MANRREFIQAAAAAAAAAPAAAGMAHASGAGAAPADIGAVVVDRRFEAARLLGAHMADRGRTVLEIEADVTELWTAHVKPLWSGRPVAVAGLTGRQALFCLEQLAWERGLRVVFHAEHMIAEDGSISHELLAGAGRPGAAEFAAGGEAWTAVFAQLLHGEFVADRPAGPSPAGLAPAQERGSETLASWIIAPRVRTA